MISQSKLCSHACFHADSITLLPTVRHLKHLSASFTTHAAASRPSWNQRSISRTPCIHPVQLTDGNACACMLSAAVLLLSSRKASLLQLGPQASTRRLKRFAGWHETRLGFAPREVILSCHPHPGDRKPNPPPGVVCKIQTKASVSGTRCPCRRRGVLRSPRLQSALLPLCRGRPLA